MDMLRSQIELKFLSPDVVEAEVRVGVVEPVEEDGGHFLGD